jgi:uncharacterized membrane protein
MGAFYLALRQTFVSSFLSYNVAKSSHCSLFLFASTITIALDTIASFMQTMGTNRIEAFSDGVIAIILTVMVLELKVPSSATLPAMKASVPTLLSYALSFLIIAIMWVNHHHMMHVAKHPTAALLWANNNLLFWMSLIPFVTAFMGQTRGAPLAVAAYGLVLTMAALGFTLLRLAIVRGYRGHVSVYVREQNRRSLRKNLWSNLLYAASVPLAFVHISLSFFIFLLIPAIYFLPEREIEKLAADLR